MKTRAKKAATSQAPKRRTTKAPAQVASPEPIAPVVDEAPRCALCESPAAEGLILCHACAERDHAGRHAAPVMLAEAEPAEARIAEDGSLRLSFDRPAATTPTRGPGKSAQLGRLLVRWLRDQQRRGGVLSDRQQADIVALAREAARAAVQELEA